jgi:apolipoprotein N-acyltransferase
MNSGRRKASFGPLAGGIATGIALVLAAPPWNAALLAWVAFWPLLQALAGQPLPTRLAAGTLAGLLWSLGTAAPWLYPAARLHLAAGVVSAATLTVTAAWIWGGVYLAALAAIYPRLPRPSWLAVPAVWVLGEMLRSHVLGGVPWSLLGHSQHGVLWLRQVAEITGVAGLSFLVAIPSAALAGPPTERRSGLIAAAVLVLLVVVFGATRTTSVLAPGMPQRIRVLSGANDGAAGVRRYAEASRASTADLTIWPEGATPGYLQEEPATRELLADAARRSGWLLIGAHRFDGHGAARRYFNSAAIIDPRGEIVATRDKRHLVPFAERRVLGLPLRLRPFTPADGTAEPVAAGGLQVGALVCWDALFPDVARELVARGADVLANVSSDLDLDRAVPQMLAFSRFRAIETRRWLVRASGVGRSVAIDPLGRVIETDDVALPRNIAPPTTFYVRHGETVPWIATALLGLLWLRRYRERRAALDPERTDGGGASKAQSVGAQPPRSTTLHLAPLLLLRRRAS